MIPAFLRRSKNESEKGFKNGNAPKTRLKPESDTTSGNHGNVSDDANGVNVIHGGNGFRNDSDCNDSRGMIDSRNGSRISGSTENDGNATESRGLIGTSGSNTSFGFNRNSSLNTSSRLSQNSRLRDRTTVLDRFGRRSRNTNILPDRSNLQPQNLTPRNRPVIPRTNSEETLVESDNSELLSLLTFSSDETAVLPTIEIFNRPISTYNQVKEFQIVSGYLQQGISIFKSKEHLNQYLLDQQSVVPYLQLNTSWQSIFKINSPIITLYKFSPHKQIFCQVYNKVISNWISYYRIKFNDDSLSDIYLLNNNSYNPTVDLEIENTKFRINGIKGNASMFGNNTFIKLYLMKPQSELLTNDLEVVNGKLILSNKLATLINKQDRQQIQNLINLDLPAINLPISTFIESNDKLCGKFHRNGIIKMFSNDDENYELILISILLILREQENKKYKGNNVQNVANVN